MKRFIRRRFPSIVLILLIGIIAILIFCRACQEKPGVEQIAPQPESPQECTPVNAGSQEPEQVTGKLENAVISTDHEPLEEMRPDAEQVKESDVEAEAEPLPCPITESEIEMLAKVLYDESNVLHWYGTKFGMSYTARQAAVAWIAFNRLDAGFADTLAGVLSYPHAFAYHPETEVTAEMYALANDVAARWWAEKNGAEDVGRTITSDYFFFSGDGKENYFRKNYIDDGTIWEWGLKDPYATD